MPFQKEKAGYAALRRILSSEKLQSLQKRFKRAPSAPDGEGRRQAEIVSHKGDICVPKIIHATDGSYHAAEIDNGYPGAEVGYLTVASVLLFLDKLKAAGREKFIDPVKFRDASDTGSIDMAVPGRGVILDDEPSAKFSMRKVLFEEMKKLPHSWRFQRVSSGHIRISSGNSSFFRRVPGSLPMPKGREVSAAEKRQASVCQR